eukprot:g5129.t1
MSHPQNPKPQEISMTDTSDGLRYEDVCLFTRVLRKPEKQLRVIPQVVEAAERNTGAVRREMSRVGYVARCRERLSKANSYRFRRRNEGGRGHRKTMGDDGTFPPSIAYDDRSLPWILLLRTDDMLTFCLKEKQHEELVKKLGEAKFRFTDKGEVERSRHLALKHHYIVELERNGRITSRKINSSDNLADVFTKALPAPQYLKLIDQFTVRLRDFDLEGARLLVKVDLFWSNSIQLRAVCST